MIEKRLFGDKDIFAIDCVIYDLSPKDSRRALGEIYFWVAGQPIGNPGVYSTLNIGVADLKLALSGCGLPRDFRYSLFEADELVRTVFHYAFELPMLDPRTFENGEKFLALMSVTGNEWTDRWVFILLPFDVTKDRFVWRDPGGAVHEAILPLGEYCRTARDFTKWFDQNFT